MPKYLVEAAYTSRGATGIVTGGGATARRKAVHEMMQSLGGSVEALYYGIGGVEAYVIVEAPDNVSMAAVSLAVSSAGGATLRTIALLTVEEMDEAAKKVIVYRGPGE